MSYVVKAFAAWHPDGFGHVREVVLRERLQDAETDARVYNHSCADPRWEAVPVEVRKVEWE